VYTPKMVVIHDGTPYPKRPVVNGERKARGLVPRDYSADPPEMFDPPSDMPLIPRAEWGERIRDKDAKKSWLKDIRDVADGGRPIRSLDQNGQGYCWYYSTTHAVMLLRAVMNQPHVRLSAHAGACKVKNFRDQGGWCGLGAEFIIKNGIPSVAHWPEKSMARTHDKEETWENAKRHRISEDWIDLDQSVYDRNMTTLQHGSCLLLNNPCPTDRNWWGHSTCDVDVVDGTASFDAGVLRHPESGKLLAVQEFDIRWATDVTAGYGRRTLNSWTEGWGTNGLGVIAGTRALANSSVCLLVTGGSDS
jgi:hypothetical protein